MPKALFILSREKERGAIDRATFDPAGRELLYEMIEAVWRVRESGNVTDLELAPIRKGFLAPEEGIWGRAGGWLAKLVDFAPETIAAVDDLAMHRNEAVRCRLCATLTDKHYADNPVWPRLKRFLADRSDSVREMAVRVCIKRQSPRMLPPLEAALEEEQDQERRERIKMAIALIKGEPYWLKESSRHQVTEDEPD